MDRKNFIKKSIMAGIAGSMIPKVAKSNTETPETSTYDKLMDQVGFNHLPNQKK